MMARTFCASILLLASLSGCSKVPANEAPTNKAPDLAHAAKIVADEKPTEDAAPPTAAQSEAVAPQTPVVDLPPEDSVANVDDATMRFPDEVTDFMVTRDGCDHFRGEEPYDAERQAYLEESIRQLCTGTDAKLADLRRRYRGDRDVLSALKGYEERIEIKPEQ